MPEIPATPRKGLLLFITITTKKRRKTVGRGKVEIQNQDFHFSTAQNACGARKKKGRLHKTLDTPYSYGIKNRKNRPVSTLL